MHSYIYTHIYTHTYVYTLLKILVYLRLRSKAKLEILPIFGGGRSGDPPKFTAIEGIFRVESRYVNFTF